MSFVTRLLNLARVRRVDRELDDEQQFHLDARVDELVARGVPRDAARAEAARRFGGRVRIREASREARLLPWLESLLRDVRLGARVLRRDRAVSAAAVLSLALAIGACTAAVSLIDALMLRPLPVADPGRLVYLTRSKAQLDIRLATLLSHAYLERLRTAAPAQIEIFSMGHQSLRQAVLPDSDGEEKLRVQYVSGNAMEVLGIGAAAGRLLRPGDDVTRGAHQVAVISHAFWARRFGAKPRAIGRAIQIEQQPYEIVGVTAAGFTGTEPGMLTDVWLPNMMRRGGDFSNPQWNWLRVWGRLAPGVDRSTVTPILQTAYTNFGRELERASGQLDSPADARSADRVELRAAATGVSALRQLFARPLIVLAVLVGVVLLIACSNIANLLLARSAAREREMTLRASIGASRARLLQQVLVEAGLLTAAAAILGLIFARAATPVIVGMIAMSDNPVYLDTTIDLRIVGFVAALGSVTTLVFALAPAIRASRATPSGALSQSGGRHTSQPAALRPLVALQIGFSVMVLFVAGLLLQSFDRLTRVDLGFAPEGLALVSIEARETLTPEAGHAVASHVLDEVRRLPGVQAASQSNWALFKGWWSGGRFAIPGRGSAQANIFWIAPGFFATIGARLLEGRELEARDLAVTPRTAVVVNDAFAHTFFPGESAVGRRLERGDDGRTVTYEIVGVVRDVRDLSVRGEVTPQVFASKADVEGTLHVRTTMDPATLTARLRELLPRVHPSLRITDVTSQSSLVNNALLRERLLAVLSGFFACVGLALAAIGLYGVSSYAVVQRVREIGIRLALGAGRATVVRAVLGGLGAALAIGLAAGLAGGVYLSRFLRTLLFEIEPIDVGTLAMSILGLLVVALAAAWRPARRAARIDPVVALREE
jgi:putative ABC transport system permease protein